MKHRASRKSGGVATVSIHTHNLAQMFNSLDPSPFWDRDLDRDAAAFIEGEFTDKLWASIWHLRVETQEGEHLGADLQAAIKHYYERLSSTKSRELHEHLRLGRLALLVGIAVFLLSMGLRELLQRVPHGPPRSLDEGLIILAWLALWRPVEELAYEWTPISRKRRLYKRLALIRVSVTRGPAFVSHVQVVPIPD
jgi:hypothetical protein